MVMKKMSPGAWLGEFSSMLCSLPNVRRAYFSWGRNGRASKLKALYISYPNYVLLGGFYPPSSCFSFICILDMGIADELLHQCASFSLREVWFPPLEPVCKYRFSLAFVVISAGPGAYDFFFIDQIYIDQAPL